MSSMNACSGSQQMANTVTTTISIFITCVVDSRRRPSHYSQNNALFPTTFSGPGYSNRFDVCVRHTFLPTGVAQRSEVDVFSGVCLFVCQFVSLFVGTITSERFNVGR